MPQKMIPRFHLQALIKHVHKPSYTFLAIVYAILFIIASDTSLAANFSLNVAEEGNISGKVVQLMIVVTVLSMAPSLLMMITSFTRLVVVFSFIRNAIGLQQSPPNSVLISLALFLTFFIMSPTLEEAYYSGVSPLMEEKISEEQALNKISEPFKKFMLSNTRTKDLELFASIAKIDTTGANFSSIPIRVVIPSFMISELRKAFEIGFLLFLPFLVIDILVSSILMAMGMMMMPPVMVSLPFKVIFFVLIDGWYMICGSLIKSYVT